MLDEVDFNGSGISRWSMSMVIGLALTVFLLFAGLIPLGHWADEFYTLRILHVHGFGALLARLHYWSPRPLAESATYFYSIAVYTFRSPLIAQALAPCWLLLLLAAVVPTWRHRASFLAASSLLAMLLLGHPVSDAFYWPIAAFAYLPTAAAAVAILAIDWSGQSGSGNDRLWIVIALLVASTSSETGALFSAIYAALALMVLRPFKSCHALLLLFALLVALIILYFQYGGRVAQSAAPYSRELFGPPTISHHIMGVANALRQKLWFDLFRGDRALVKHLSRTTGIVTKLLFFCGIYLAISVRRPRLGTNRHLDHMRLVLGGTSLLTAILILAASLYNFGTDCCERHDTMRQVYLFVAIGAFATYLAGRWPAKHGSLAAPVLLAALLIPLYSDAPKLLTDYWNYGNFLDARRLTWQSGQAPGSILQIAQVAPGRIVGGFLLPARAYTFRSRNNLISGMLGFYGKETAEVKPPMQATRP